MMFSQEAAPQKAQHIDSNSSRLSGFSFAAWNEGQQRRKDNISGALPDTSY